MGRGGPTVGPGVGVPAAARGILRTWPMRTSSFGRLFAARIAADVVPNRCAMSDIASPATTVYVTSGAVVGAAVGVEIPAAPLGSRVPAGTIVGSGTLANGVAGAVVETIAALRRE